MCDTCPPSFFPSVAVVSTTKRVTKVKWQHYTLCCNCMCSHTFLISSPFWGSYRAKGVNICKGHRHSSLMCTKTCSINMHSILATFKLFAISLQPKFGMFSHEKLIQALHSDTTMYKCFHNVQNKWKSALNAVGKTRSVEEQIQCISHMRFQQELVASVAGHSNIHTCI